MQSPLRDGAPPRQQKRPEMDARPAPHDQRDRYTYGNDTRPITFSGDAVAWRGTEAVRPPRKRRLSVSADGLIGVTSAGQVVPRRPVGIAASSFREATADHVANGNDGHVEPCPYRREGVDIGLAV